MSQQSSYNLAKFEEGIVYFIKEHLGQPNSENSVSKISAIVNLKELKEHAQYIITVIETETGHKQEYPIHGSYLTPNNIMNIAVSHIKRDPSIMSGLERIA